MKIIDKDIDIGKEILEKIDTDTDVHKKILQIIDKDIDTQLLPHRMEVHLAYSVKSVCTIVSVIPIENVPFFPELYLPDKMTTSPLPAPSTGFWLFWWFLQLNKCV